MTTDAQSNEQAALSDNSIRMNAIRSYNKYQVAASSNAAKSSTTTEDEVVAHESSTTSQPPLPSTNKIVSE